MTWTPGRDGATDRKNGRGRGVNASPPQDAPPTRANPMKRSLIVVAASLCFVFPGCRLGVVTAIVPDAKGGAWVARSDIIERCYDTPAGSTCRIVETSIPAGAVSGGSSTGNPSSNIGGPCKNHLDCPAGNQCLSGVCAEVH
jgi:hypothetical protein